MPLKCRKKVIFGFLLFALCVAFFSLNLFTEEINKMIAIGVLLLSVVWVYQCWNELCLLIISLFILYSNYSIVVGIYLDKSLRPVYLYPQITDVKIYGIGIAMIFLVVLLLVFLTPKYRNRHANSISSLFIRKENYSSALFYALFVVFVAFMMLGYTAGSGSRGSSSALYEYNIIVLLGMFYYSGCRKECRIICAICSVIYVFMSLLNGTRVEALACIIILFLCITRRKVKNHILLLGMFGGVLVFSCVGTIRGGAFSAELGKKIINNLLDNKLVFDTCTHAYFPMLCMIEQFQTYSLSDAFHYLMAFLGTILMGQSRVTDGDLIKTVARFYYHNYGGVTLGFFWVWFSYVGAAVFAAILRGYTHLIEKSDLKLSDLRLCVIIYVTATVPRWYLYGPWSLTRGVLVCIVAFSIFRLGARLFRKEHKRVENGR